MKKSMLKMILCIVFLSYFFCIEVPQSFAIESNDALRASSKVQIYSQWDVDSYGNNQDNWLNTSGCGWFSIGHALQWLGIIPRDKESTGSQLAQLCAESGYIDTVSNLENALKWMVKKYPNTFEYKKNGLDLVQVLNASGVAIIHQYGHYYTAVDISSDGQFVHIVDSSLMVPNNNKVKVYLYNSNSKTFETTTIANCAARTNLRWYCGSGYVMYKGNVANPLYAGGDYWVRINEVSSKVSFALYCKCGHDDYYRSSTNGVCQICHAWNPNYVQTVRECDVWLALNGTEAKAIRPGPYNDCGKTRDLLAGEKVHAIRLVKNCRGSNPWYELDRDDSGKPINGYIFSDNVKETSAPTTNPVTPTVSFAPWSNDRYTYVYWTDAGIGQEINVSSGTCTKIGMYLYDAYGNFLAEAFQYEYANRVYFKINEGCHYTLTPGTTYKYKFFAIVNGETYWADDYSSFTTGGPSPTPQYGTLDVNGDLDSNIIWGNVEGFGTFDVYINGNLVCDDWTDYYNSALEADTSYTITDIRATNGHIYIGDASISGTITANSTSDIRLRFLSQYTISFDANGGSGAPASQVKTHDTALTLSPTWPTRAGFTFQGWGTSASATSPTYYATGSYTANAAATLYAVWKPNSYTVSLNANGGTVEQTSISVIYGETYSSLPVPSCEGYLFDGWYTASTGGIKVISTTKVTTAINHTLYAHWRKNPNKMELPVSLKRIENEAFMGCALASVVIPEQCRYIGSKAFANSDELVYVYFPQTDMQIASDAFSRSPNVTIICHTDSSAHVFAKANGIPYILYQSDWVSESEVPQGARITAEKWTYKRATTETTTSTEESMNGWTQTGFTWQRAGGGTHTYAYYPAGFDTGHALYSYAKGPLSSSASGNTKREAAAASHKSYIYWHWTFTDVLYSTNRNVVIDDKIGYGVDVYDDKSTYRDFIYFDAFETTLSLSPEGMGKNGLTTRDGVFSTYHHPEYNLPEYASWWWFRFDVYQQSYTDYQKLFSYQKTTFTDEESTSPVSEGGNISNVRHLVKYEF